MDMKDSGHISWFSDPSRVDGLRRNLWLQGLWMLATNGVSYNKLSSVATASFRSPVTSSSVSSALPRHASQKLQAQNGFS